MAGHLQFVSGSEMVVSPSSSSDQQQLRHVQLVSQAQETLVPYDDAEPSQEPSQAGLAAQRSLPVADMKQLRGEMPAQDVCMDNDGDLCSECGVMTPQGGSGHVFWDELEMMRHGWCDKQGHHWNKISMPRDEAQLLQDGVVSRDCQHQSCSSSALICSPPPPTSFDSEPPIHCAKQWRCYSEQRRRRLTPILINWSVTDNTDQLSAEMSVTRADMLQTQSEMVAIDGGGTLTKMGMGQEHRVYQLVLGSRRLFLERGPDAHLVLHTEDTVRRRHATI